MLYLGGIQSDLRMQLVIHNIPVHTEEQLARDAQPWNNHAKIQDKIVQHARTHGAVGFTSHRNSEEMRLDWARRRVRLQMSWLMRRRRDFLVLAMFMTTCGRREGVRASFSDQTSPF